MFDFFTLYILQSVNAKKLKEVCTKYIYDRCPAMAVVGKENLHSIYNFVHLETGKENLHSIYNYVNLEKGKENLHSFYNFVIQKQVRRICNMEVYYR